MRPYAYKYRDYVVRSLNADRPWDVLIREQLAGDEMVSAALCRTCRRRTSTASSPRGSSAWRPTAPATPRPISDRPRNDVIAETIKIVSTALLGLTVGCAQCHAHRYDPITQEDYYRFRALFEPAYDPSNWRTPAARLVSLWTDADRQRDAEVQAEVAAIAEERATAVEELVAEGARARARRGARGAARQAPRGPRDAPVEAIGRAEAAPEGAIRASTSRPGNVSLYDAKGVQRDRPGEFAKRDRRGPEGPAGRGLRRRP